MTREEAIAFAESELKAAYERVEKIGLKRKTRYIEVLEMAIQALEQEPCEDTISRQNDILPNIDKVVKSYKKVIKNPVVKSIMDMDETQEQLDFVQSHKRIPVTLTVSDDLISRQQTKAYLYDRIERLNDDELYDIFSKIIDDMVNELPSVKPQERTGHWEWVQYDYNPKIGNWHCTECRCIVVECVDKNEKGGIPLYKYCPQCGAKMEVEQNG